ncbi:S-adenosylmethionine uptake transporter [Parasphingorhabdus marina DSM 22363]|uniref:S-adenosylmethionine uptake transporter n=1 Tax=Parasphingorhabdus marina DSM 22363 TaxID=1123272 RepID=A0A1N6CSS7_9SPHN|nr:DMT family transporter [Parasphingorhabdus marina]SIN61519.1 S-adenosylmethionine uptake transporter [Parasphingorhabdus marina DSM 22363]
MAMSSPASSEQHSAPLLPMGSVLLGLLTFSMMDVAMKSLSMDLGAYNAILWRVLASLVMVSVIFFARRPRMPSPAARKIHLQRGIIVVFMSYLFFWGLARVPLAEAIALSFIAPIIALYLAAVFLGEAIQRSAIWASLLGFIGVIVIAVGRAQGGYSEDSLLGIGAILLSALLYAGNLVIQRRQALLADPIEISFSQNLIVGTVFLLFAPYLAVVPDVTFVPLIGGAAILSIVSAVFIAWGYARAEAQNLINLEYSAFIWAAIFGWIFFSEPLTLTTVGGTILIVAGCILATRRDKPVAHVETTAV